MEILIFVAGVVFGALGHYLITLKSSKTEIAKGEAGTGGNPEDLKHKQ